MVWLECYQHWLILALKLIMGYHNNIHKWHLSGVNMSLSINTQRKQRGLQSCAASYITPLTVLWFPVLVCYVSFHCGVASPWLLMHAVLCGKWESCVGSSSFAHSLRAATPHLEHTQSAVQRESSYSTAHTNSVLDWKFRYPCLCCIDFDLYTFNLSLASHPTMKQWDINTAVPTESPAQI